MATLTLNFTPPTPTPANGYIVKYRLKGSSGAYTTVSPNPTSMPIVIGGLQAHKNYEGTIQSSCADGFTSSVVNWSSNKTFVTYWAADDFICEQDSVFVLARTITGFSSPAFLMYDNVSGRVYGVDHDDPSGNFFSFLPGSINGKDSLTYYNVHDTIYSYAGDPVYRRVYAAGKDTGGLKVLDIATGNVTTKPYGMDHTGNTVSGNGFNRLGITVLTNNIICYDDYTKSITIFDRATLAQVGSTLPLSSIPSGTAYISGYPVYKEIGSEIWVIPNQAGLVGGVGGNIARYNSSFSSLIGTIDLTSAGLAYKSVLWDNLKFWRDAYYDADNNRLYVYDFGSNYMVVINTSTRTVIYSKKVTNTEEYTNSSLGFVIDPTTNDLYLAGRLLDNTVSAYKLRTYKINRTTYAFENIFVGTAFQNLTAITGTNSLFGAQPNNTIWVGGSWSSDGVIYQYTK